MFDDSNYTERLRIDLYLQTYKDKKIQILSTIMSHDNKYLCVCVGEKQIKEEVKVVGMVILARQFTKDDRYNNINGFIFYKDFDFEVLGMENVCQYMYFDGKDSHKLIMIANQICMTFDILTSVTQTIYKLQGWDQHPDLLVFNHDQSVFIISSKSDSMMINIE